MGDATQQRPSFWLIAQLREGLTRDQFRKAVNDLWDGLGRRALWSTMGLQEIRLRYRRSIIGPFWLTISMGVTVGALGLLYNVSVADRTHSVGRKRFFRMGSVCFRSTVAAPITNACRN